MAQTLSLAIVIGNLGADPEIRTGQDGHRVALFRLATDISAIGGSSKPHMTDMKA
ncbi:single-stranded DNA-binding protein [Acetobacter malorum]|uniref:single-stranded DNA-binding protein n=1 Tax=Acetobacter malorum TaxID=178901 RepID=UPI000AC37817|nr:single-stranded DNA-binding protein [Acetobacter malorum]